MKKNESKWMLVLALAIMVAVIAITLPLLAKRDTKPDEGEFERPFGAAFDPETEDGPQGPEADKPAGSSSGSSEILIDPECEPSGGQVDPNERPWWADGHDDYDIHTTASAASLYERMHRADAWYFGMPVKIADGTRYYGSADGGGIGDYATTPNIYSENVKLSGFATLRKSGLLDQHEAYTAKNVPMGKISPDFVREAGEDRQIWVGLFSDEFGDLGWVPAYAVSAYDEGATPGTPNWPDDNSAASDEPETVLLPYLGGESEVVYCAARASGCSD